MRTKILSGIVIAVFFLGLMSLGLSALPSKADISGFWQWVAQIVALEFIWGGSAVAAFYVIKRFCK